MSAGGGAVRARNGRSADGDVLAAEVGVGAACGVDGVDAHAVVAGGDGDGGGVADLGGALVGGADAGAVPGGLEGLGELAVDVDVDGGGAGGVGVAVR